MPTNVTAVSITHNSVTIQWTLEDTFNPANPDTFTVLYGDTPEHFNFSTQEINSEEDNEPTYSLKLTSLESATQYFYIIRSKTELGQVDTELMNFTTLLASSEFYLEISV